MWIYSGRGPARTHKEGAVLLVMVAPSDRLGSVWGIFYARRGVGEGENWKQTPPATPARPLHHPPAQRAHSKSTHPLNLVQKHKKDFRKKRSNYARNVDQNYAGRIGRGVREYAVLQSIRPGSGRPSEYIICARACVPPLMVLWTPERCNWWTHWRVRGNLALERCNVYSARANKFCLLQINFIYTCVCDALDRERYFQSNVGKGKRFELV